MKRLAYSLLRIIIASYIGLCVVLYLFQDALIYHPQPRAVSEPGSTLKLKTEDTDIIVTTEIKPGNKAIIYFGGNAEDVSRNLESFKQTFPNHSLYLMHYRGYGGSSGEPSEERNYQDAVKLYDLIKKDRSEISLIGRSLGSGIATHLASIRPVSKLALVTPYYSIEEIAQQQYPFVPVSLLLKDKYQSWQYAKQIKAPTTIIMAEGDRIIPNSSSEKLYSQFQPGIAKLVSIKGAGHNRISAKRSYYSALAQAVIN